MFRQTYCTTVHSCVPYLDFRGWSFLAGCVDPLWLRDSLLALLPAGA